MFLKNALFINQEKILNSERIPDVWPFYLNRDDKTLLSLICQIKWFFIVTDNCTTAALANAIIDIISSHKHP